MQTEQCVGLHSGTVAQMFYAIASAIKGTLTPWGQAESSYFRHLWQAGVEPGHLAAGSTTGGLSAAAGLQLPWACRSLWGHTSAHQRPLSVLYKMSQEGESADGKAIRGYQTQRHQQLQHELRQVLYDFSSSQNPPQASADGSCPAAGGLTAGWTDWLVWPRVHSLLSHTVIQIDEGRVH